VRPVSNTTPLIHLARVGQIELLRDLYGLVYVPPTVLDEARHHVDEAVSAALAAGWLAERRVADPSGLDELERALGGRGEAEAIALALEISDSVLLVDERAARELARARGLRVRGSVGVLIEAKRRGRLPMVRTVLDSLRASGFWLDDRTYAAALEMAEESDATRA
jgi:hypothetical protein